MCEQKLRRNFAKLIRRFAIGRITNDQFEDAYFDLDTDLALHNLFYHALWPLYSDVRTHKLLGKYALSRDGKRWIARIILFLQTDNQYRNWCPPKYKSGEIYSLWLFIFTLGRKGITESTLESRGYFIDEQGNTVYANEDIWPFESIEAYNQALKNPIYLSGS